MSAHELLRATVESTIPIFGHPVNVMLSGYGIAVIFTNIVAYLLLIWHIFIRDTPPPIASWGMWFVTDVVATVAELQGGILNLQLATYTAGTFVICLVLLIWRRNFTWHMLWDNLTAAFVLFSLVILLFANDPLWALCAALFAMTVAALPLIRGIWDGVDETADVWTIVALGSVFSYLEGHLLSGVWTTILQVTIVGLIFFCRKRRRMVMV